MEEKIIRNRKLLVGWPVIGKFPITSHFGETRVLPSGVDIHKGTDIDCPIGTPIIACAPGRLVRVGWEDENDHKKGFGLRVMQEIKYQGETFFCWYGHMSALHVHEGQVVTKGQQLGLSGNTGRIKPAPGNDGSHLCLRFRLGGTNEFIGPEFDHA